MAKLSHFRGAPFARALTTLTVVILVNACGAPDFGSMSPAPSTPKSSEGTKKTPNPVSPTLSLTSLDWYWQCESDPGTAPVASNSKGVVQDGGDHLFSKTNFAASVPVTISGRVCPPAKYPRDIVLVIDVSGSMGGSGGNDRQKSGSCGRMAAVDAIVTNVTAQSPNARFAIVTFSDNVNAHSTAMFTDKNSLYADIAGSQKLSDVLCEYDSGTAYGPALSSAEKILSTSRANAMKEIYFISDGAPTDGNAGSTIATRLKSTGVNIQGTMTPVQIATIMLGGEKNGPTTLQSIASVGTDTKPLYALATDSSQLASTLSALAANDIDTGTIKYRPIGSSTWTEVSLKGLINNYNFTIPAFNVSVQTAQFGIEATLEYRDLHNNVRSSGGALKWQATP